MTIKTGSIWQHKISGKSYRVLCVANKNSLHKDFVETVVYQGDDGEIWARNADVFLEKFVEFNRV